MGWCWVGEVRLVVDCRLGVFVGRWWKNVSGGEEGLNWFGGKKL